MSTAGHSDGTQTSAMHVMSKGYGRSPKADTGLCVPMLALQGMPTDARPSEADSLDVTDRLCPSPLTRRTRSCGNQYSHEAKREDADAVPVGLCGMCRAYHARRFTAAKLQALNDFGAI